MPEGTKLVGFSVYGEQYAIGADTSSLYGDVYVMDDDLKVLGTARFRYNNFQLQPAWIDIYVQEMDVPEKFWVFINPHANSMRGIYFYYDRDIEVSHSKTGRDPSDLHPIHELREWMIRAYLKKPARK